MPASGLVMAALLASNNVSPAAVVKTLFAAFNRHDVPALQRLYSPKATLTSSDFCRPRTVADVTRTYRALFAAYPDIRDDVGTVVIEGDRAAVRFTSESRAAGKSFRMRLVTFFRFNSRGIVEDDTIFDTGGRPCEP